MVAVKVGAGEVERGILICGSGIGMAIAANKVPGVRAALCHDAETARGARMWNDANVLAIGLMATDAGGAEAILDAWLETTQVDPGESRNIARVAALERRYATRPGDTA